GSELMKKTISGLALVLCFVVTAQSAQETQTLVSGKPIEREIAGGESHIYQIQLAAGQFMHLVVRQKGIDVGVQLMAPGNKPLAEANLTDGFGQESLSHEAAVGGDYRIAIRTVAAAAPIGAYEAKLEVKLAATAQDKQRIETERLLAEAGKLSEQAGGGLPETREKAP